MTFPAIPDSIFKLLVLLGLAFILYAYFSRQNELANYEKTRMDYEVDAKRLIYDQSVLKEDLQDIKEEADNYSRKMGLENPLSISDSGYSFTRTISGEEKHVTLSDTIENLLKRHAIKTKELAHKNSDLNIKNYQLEQLSNRFDEADNFSLILGILGGVLLFIGVTLWITHDDLAKEILKRQNLQLPTYSKCCQSCGRMFNSIIKYGTDKNSITNYHFCNNCYSDGEFVEQEISLLEMQEKIKSELRNKKIKKITINYIVNNIKGLDRWKTNNYI